MTNEYFKISSLEEDQEVYSKWRILTKDEQLALNRPKARVYLSVADMDMLQDALELLAEEGVGHGREVNKRRVMQMGYGLEEIKHKLQKRIDKESK